MAYAGIALLIAAILLTDVLTSLGYLVPLLYLIPLWLAFRLLAPWSALWAAGMFDEAAKGSPSHVTADLTQDPELTDDEIRERMSGNLCRCAAYPNIVEALRHVARGEGHCS